MMIHEQDWKSQTPASFNPDRRILSTITKEQEHITWWKDKFVHLPSEDATQGSQRAKHIPIDMRLGRVEVPAFWSGTHVHSAGEEHLDVRQEAEVTFDGVPNVVFEEVHYHDKNGVISFEVIRGRGQQIDQEVTFCEDSQGWIVCNAKGFGLPFCK